MIIASGGGFLWCSFLNRLKYAGLTICFTVLLSGVFFITEAQYIDPHITFLSSKSEMKIANQEIADITVKVQNKGNAAISGYFDIKLPEDLRLLSKNHLDILLMPGDSVFVPVKIFVSKQAAADKAYPLLMRLTADEKVIAETGCNVHINIKKSVSLTPLVSSILLNPQTDTIKIPVNISNSGNTFQKVSIIAQFPYHIEGVDKPYTIQLSLLPSADTIVYFKRIVNRRMLASDEFDVTLTGLYANGEIFGMGYTKIQSAKGIRRYVNENYTDNNTYNSISLSSQNMFAPNQDYLFNGRGSIDFPGSKLRYSFDITTYRNNYSPDMIRNTYIDYETHNMGLTVGNINRNFEINMNGEGATFFLNDTARRNLYEAGYISANTNLFQKTPFGIPSLGTESWFSAGHRNKKWDILSTFLMQKSPFLNTNNMILSNKFNWHSQKLNIAVSFNGGRTTDLTNNESKYSSAFGLNLSGKLQNWEYTSINYMSSGYYPGVSRGATTLSERITHIGTDKSEWVSMDYFNYLPNYFSNSFSYLPQYSNLRLEIGESKKIKAFTLSIAPTYSKETNNSYVLSFNNTSSQQNPISIFNALDLHTIMSYPISISRYINVNMQGGMYNSSMDSHYQFHYDLISNYSDPIFNINASIQFGNVNLGEVVNNYLHPDVRNRVIMIAPNVHKNFFHKKALAETGLTYLNSSIYGSSILLTGRFTYEILTKTTIYVAVNHNQYVYAYGAYHNNIIEAGITQKLPSIKVVKKSISLGVFVYKDNNHNSV
ncbi:MAG: hypothetical protein JWQ06_215, partial [Mucilaginibacter sp.]|nr:hypothetical protein [Mucilaginibacter sp.]